MALEKFDFDLVHSSVSFTVRHLMISKVRGRFEKWGGTLLFDEAAPGTSQLDINIDAASIDTKEAQRDTHLKSPDFLDVEKFPQIAFKSTAIEGAGSHLKVYGDLTIHGTTRPVTLEVDYAGRVKDPWGGERIGFSAHTSLSRKDFGLTWNIVLEAGGLTVGDKVDIDIEIEATKAKT